MKPLRQIETAEYMISNNNFTLPFIMAILSTTRPEMLAPAHSIDGNQAISNSGLEKEHEGLVRDLKAVEKSFGIDMLTLAVSLKYLRLLTNGKVRRYLEVTYPELLAVLSGL
jgi:RepB plasmid partitioning protein